MPCQTLSQLLANNEWMCRTIRWRAGWRRGTVNSMDTRASPAQSFHPVVIHIQFSWTSLQHRSPPRIIFHCTFWNGASNAIVQDYDSSNEIMRRGGETIWERIASELNYTIGECFKIYFVIRGIYAYFLATIRLQVDKEIQGS